MVGIHLGLHAEQPLHLEFIHIITYLLLTRVLSLPGIWTPLLSPLYLPIVSFAEDRKLMSRKMCPAKEMLKL